MEDKDIASRFAQGTNWCVKDPSTAQMYLNSGPLHFIFVDNKKTVLINGATDQIKETNDAPLRNYSVIRRVHPILEQLGLDQRTGGTYGDFEKYHQVLQEGQIVNQRVAEQIANGGDASEAIRLLYPDAESQSDALLYLEDQYIENPAIQAMCSAVFVPKLNKNVKEFYRLLPRKIQLIPQIFDVCKEKFVELILANPGTYAECSNDLKKLPEIQKAHFSGYVLMVRKDPALHEENIPDEFRGRPEMKRARYDGWLEFIRIHPERDLPSPFDVIPEMKAAQAAGWFEKLEKDPDSYHYCPEEIKSTDKAQGIVWDACLREVENDPRTYYSKVPQEFQDDPYIRETVIKGWVNLIRKNPLHMYQCPSELAELDVIKNAYSRESDAIEQPDASSEDVRSSQIRNWVARINNRLEDWKNVPKDLKDVPELFNAALNGWVERIKMNPFQINYCPPEFKKRPEIREKLYERNPAMREQKNRKADTINWYRLAIMSDPEICRKS